MQRKEEFFLGAVGRRGELLFRGFLGGGDAEAKFTGLGGIEGGAQGLRERLRAGVFGEHFSPSEDLHRIQQRAVGAEPGEEEAGDGDVFSHARVERRGGKWAGRVERGKRDFW